MTYFRPKNLTLKEGFVFHILGPKDWNGWDNTKTNALTLIHLTGVHKRLTLFKHITLKIKCEKVL